MLTFSQNLNGLFLSSIWIPIHQKRWCRLVHEMLSRETGPEMMPHVWQALCKYASCYLSDIIMFHLSHSSYYSLPVGQIYVGGSTRGDIGGVWKKLAFVLNGWQPNSHLFHLKKLTQDTCDVRQLCQEGYVRHKIGEEGGTHVTGDMSPGQGV